MIGEQLRMFRKLDWNELHISVDGRTPVKSKVLTKLSPWQQTGSAAQLLPEAPMTEMGLQLNPKRGRRVAPRPRRPPVLVAMLPGSAWVCSPGVGHQ